MSISVFIIHLEEKRPLLISLSFIIYAISEKYVSNLHLERKLIFSIFCLIMIPAFLTR